MTNLTCDGDWKNCPLPPCKDREQCGLVRHAAPDRATEALAWASDVFGLTACDEEERAMRFFEEAVELVRALEYQPSKQVLLQIFESVYSREPGAVSEEVGQAMLTLEMLSAAAGFIADDEAEKEFRRVQAIPPEEWARRRKAKVALGIAK